MQALACEIGLHPHEFWTLTPAEFRQVAEGYHNRQRRSDYRAAFIVSAVYNVNRDSKKKRTPYTPEDFLGGRRERTVQTPEQMLERVKMLHRALGGEKRG